MLFGRKLFLKVNLWRKNEGMNVFKLVAHSIYYAFTVFLFLLWVF